MVAEEAGEESVFDRLGELASEYERLERELADPAIHADQAKARALGRRYAELGSVVHAYQEWRKTVGDGQAARELAAEDPSFTAEAEQLERRQAELEERLQRSLVPRDPADGKDVILEVKAGEGGEESALFAGDLLRMYLRYAQRRGWQTEILDSTPSDLGGFKDVTVAVKAAFVPGLYWVLSIVTPAPILLSGAMLKPALVRDTTRLFSENSAVMV